MKTQIREATKADYHVIHQLHRQIHEIHTQARPDHYVMAEITLDENYYDNLLEADYVKVFLLEVECRPAAYTVVTINKPKEIPVKIPKVIAFINEFGVEVHYRGKGLGRLLFEYVVKYAKEMGACSLELGVWEFNQDAIKFYESMKMKTRTRKMELEL